MPAAAGWAKPENRLKGERVHYWKGNGKKICSPHSTQGYVGPKIQSALVSVDEVCVKCLTEVRAQEEV